ncbi:MAG: hypothetical protein JSW67_00610 [Candidatus Latescibacterota bacterium]|nr:MAG: hypothetical protein JSW67_00610 [Candidatus Latescibacterota bacterium]
MERVDHGNVHAEGKSERDVISDERTFKIDAEEGPAGVATVVGEDGELASHLRAFAERLPGLEFEHPPLRANVIALAPLAARRGERDLRLVRFDYLCGLVGGVCEAASGVERERQTHVPEMSGWLEQSLQADLPIPGSGRRPGAREAEPNVSSHGLGPCMGWSQSLRRILVAAAAHWSSRMGNRNHARAMGLRKMHDAASVLARGRPARECESSLESSTI